MALPVATSPLDTSEGEVTKGFHSFPDLPAELRIRIWQMAYDALPDTLVYRFRLKFSFIQESEEPAKPQAYLVPLEEVGYLTSELRSLQRVNTESRHEGERLFGSCLRFNQTEKGEATDLCPPINLPWKGTRNFFCFVGLDEPDVACLLKANTALIDQVFSTVELLGLGLDRAIEVDIDYYFDFAEFILLLPKIRHASVVSDLLMSEADLDNIDEDTRSNFTLSSWNDWVGRVPEDVITSHCEYPKVVTKNQHLDAVSDFTEAMIHYGDTIREPAGALLGVDYGMIFRTEENLDFLLWDVDLLEQLFSDEMNEMLSERFSDESGEEFGESSEEDEDT
jgi:hypothetical protein